MSELYPYLYTRGAFLKKKLLKKSDYEKILKMDFKEIAKFLQESDYKEAIDELGVEKKGADLIEAALNNQLAHTFTHVRGFLDRENRQVVDIYLERWDIQNMKTVLRLVHNGQKTADESLFVDAGKMSRKDYVALIDVAGLEEAIAGFTLNAQVKEQLTSAAKSGLLEVENVLDRYYYEKMFSSARKLGEEQYMFKRFLRDEVLIVNMKTVLRFLAQSKEGARDFVISSGKDHPVIQEMLQAKNLDAASETMIKAGFTEAKGDLLDIELALDRHLILKYLSPRYMNPSSIGPVLAVLFMKATEVENLKRFVKARQLGMDESFIEQKVIVPCWR